MNPHVGGILWPVSVIGAVMVFFVGVVVILAITLEVIEGAETPLLFGRTTYTLVGSAGFLGTSIGMVRIIYDWGVILGINPTWESIVAAVLVVVPSAYAFYRLWRPQDSVRTPSKTNESEFEPQYVRDKTAQWSSEETQRQSTPETVVPQRQLQSRDTEREPQQKRQTDKNQSGYLSDLEFGWTTDMDVDFDAVGGMDELKTELERDVIKPLTTHREKAEELGITPTNILFYGPPGTGKTYLAEALATELDLPFAQLSGADIQSKWINESAQKVNALFKEARKVAKHDDGAVIFLDELDSVLKKRAESGNAHEEDNKVVNEFLNHLEDISDHGIVFLGATNRLDALDSAGIRSGRINKKVHVGMPDTGARTSILEAQLRDRSHILTKEQIKAIAEQTDGMTAADLASLVEDAARISLYQRDDDKITQNDMYQALAD